MIPLVDLTAQHREIADVVGAGFERVLSSGEFIGGVEVERFEAAMATYTGRRHCVGVANGTDALELVLRAAGIGPGDEVIVPAATFIATAEAPARCGARVVVADVDPDTLLLDPAQVERRLTARTRAVIPVHLYGRLAPIDPLLELVEGTGIALIEDAAQCQGARRLSGGAGSGTLAATMSFYPGKNLGAYGDAGAVLTDDPHLAARVRAIANHGSTRRYHHDLLGQNSRLDALQAVVLAAKLERLDDWNATRRDLAHRYRDRLGGLPVGVPSCPARPSEHVWHLFPIRLGPRDAALEALHAAGVGAGVHYPRVVHHHPPFASGAHCPVAEDAFAHVLSLPLHPHLSIEDQDRIVDELAVILHRLDHSELAALDPSRDRTESQNHDPGPRADHLPIRRATGTAVMPWSRTRGPLDALGHR
jgi:dTDP-4-amino-4,6-dideoxygalactose transaminase